MKKFKNSILGVFAGITLLVATTAFIIKDPQADFVDVKVSTDDPIALSEITTKHSEKGAFKSSVRFKQEHFEGSEKEFYGQEIRIADNPQLDRVLIGVTNKLISRVEVWNHNELIEERELGFVGKMTWGETQTMTVNFHDQTNEKYNGKSKISMRFYSGAGFLGDIGTIHLDLTEYGDLSGDKSIGVFAKSTVSNSVNEPLFSDLHIWKNYRSFD